MPADYQFCPNHIRESLDRYVNERMQPGGFLLAMLSNDLRETIGRADENNLRVLPHIFSYVYNRMPSNCWGTPEKVALWLKREE